ncbi:hypothetical protein JCM15765_04030 [Paradesulfitobacterium aromaticivorans]
MDTGTTNIITTIITAASGIIGALIGGRAANKAALRQIQEERIIREQDKKEREIVTISVILRFLWYGINKNMEILNYFGNGWCWEKLKTEIKPFEHEFSVSLYFKEYEEIKYELLKYDHKLIRDVLEIYDLFTLLDKHKDIKKLSQDEFDRLKELASLFESLKLRINEQRKKV